MGKEGSAWGAGGAQRMGMMTQRQIAGGGAAAATLPRSAGPGSEGEYSEGRRPARGCRGGANRGVISTPWLAHARLGSSRAQPPHACARARATHARRAGPAGELRPHRALASIMHSLLQGEGVSSCARARVCLHVRASARAPACVCAHAIAFPSGHPVVVHLLEVWRTGPRESALSRALWHTRAHTHTHTHTVSHTRRPRHARAFAPRSGGTGCSHKPKPTRRAFGVHTPAYQGLHSLGLWHVGGSA